MSRAALPASLALALAGCTTVVVSQPTLDRELARALEGRRLGAVAARVLAFRDGVLREALDRGRIDREERARAAARVAADLRAALRGVHAGRLDADDGVDLDLALGLLDEAEADLALAASAEPRLRELAGPATALAPLAEPGPPGPAALALLGPEAFPAEVPPPPAEGVAAADPEDLRSAAARCRQAAGLLKERAAQASILDPAFPEGKRKEVEAAAARAEAHAGALDEAAKKVSDARGGRDRPLGREGFAARLRLRHGVDASPEDLEAFGTDLLDRTTRELEALATAEFPGKTWREALEQVRGDHADAASLPAEALAAAEAARDFAIREGLVTIPPEARRAHVELVGDEMARSYPFAAYGWRRDCPEGESGRYMVSPGATWMTPEQREERLRGNCRAWTRVVASHETWPGHHLQIWIADRFASPVRRAASTPVYVEGWGLYCEGLLLRHGFFRTPSDRLTVLVMRAWRAARVIYDVRLHCKGAPAQEAIDFLVERTGATRDGATAEVRRWLSMPTQPFSYAWGCREIERLRSDEERRLGPAFSGREFHDRLLRCGPVPFRYVRRLFGYGGPAPGDQRPR